jgi:hypothetical protein
MSWDCTYSNPSNLTIQTGDSEEFDEQCFAIAYFFPATKPLVCVNGSGPF